LVFAALLVLALAVAGIASAIEVENGAVVAEGDLDSITAVGGHPRAEWVIEPSYDCTSYRRAYFTCNVGDTTHDHWVKIAPSGHKWSSTTGDAEWGRVVVEPTCTTPGYAIDVCVKCGAENPQNTRPIDPRKHEYDDKHYDVVKEPSCGEDGNGLGWRTCILCGQRHPDTTGATDGTAGEHLVILDKIKHNWSDWRVDYDSTCDYYGQASRTCIRCGAVQHLYDEVVDQGKTIKIGDVLPLKNEAWTVNGTKLDGAVFDKYSDLQKALTELKFEYEVEEDWLVDCGERHITYTCPYCHGYSDNHSDFTVIVKEEAHDWKEERDPYVSVPAWCTTDGYDIFFCKHDPEKHGHSEAFDKDPADVTFADGFKKVITKAVGHDWGDWTASEVFEKGGKKYGVYFRSCKRCGATEQKTEAVKKPGLQGLAQTDDGRWAYFVDGEISADTLLVPFQGGEFWVVKGYVANASGLTICPDGKAYFLVYGQVARVSQWAEYNGEWFIIENGLLNPVTGLRVYGGSTFAVQDGQMMQDLDGLFGDPETGKIAYCKGGMVQTGFSGTVEYDGETYTVENGYVVR
jgi:hypothetical protein